MEISDVQLENAPFPIDTTVFGTVIDVRHAHPANI